MNITKLDDFGEIKSIYRFEPDIRRFYYDETRLTGDSEALNVHLSLTADNPEIGINHVRITIWLAKEDFPGYENLDSLYNEWYKYANEHKDAILDIIKKSSLKVSIDGYVSMISPWYKSFDELKEAVEEIEWQRADGVEL